MTSSIAIETLGDTFPIFNASVCCLITNPNHLLDFYTFLSDCEVHRVLHSLLYLTTVSVTSFNMFTDFKKSDQFIPENGNMIWINALCNFPNVTTSPGQLSNFI